MKFMKHEEAFTGLEAAIVLIAFVVVAAVFSYVMLGAGFFTSQKSQEVVHTSVDQASSSLEIHGDVYGLDSDDGDNVDLIDFTITLTAGGSPVDVPKVAITFQNSTYAGVVTYDKTQNGSDPNTANTWCIYKKVDSDDDTLLEFGEQFVIRLKPKGELPPDDKFSVDIKPPVGAALGLKRTIPPQVDAVNLLY
ncbi:flagellin domain protein [Methanofollis liminatans DSM 4140]|uniref:Flagellin n=1 Tax=Methanofollis liminatans DSM 4140 TaxID=28892 RepID=J1L391_9EURY|nr:archaellin/type IV pilin N-terminal domain-containing protein [Methanofollis liminatans]EJG07190.1 flagellin domain protein [Methanofollis liminatans DSM 4140]